ncbi:hypothetical protein MANES_13G014723v8 [Manihot esculenta]|uniref:Uncharacterized protein n=1 Tax=Manihot esculenta TaxID=3983 RepID=A0ACB7GJ66_MANES|nr:hypothetical protein MANES_13G014723v8 [Manihot esculenta]
MHRNSAKIPQQTKNQKRRSIKIRNRNSCSPCPYPNLFSS